MTVKADYVTPSTFLSVAQQRVARMQKNEQLIADIAAQVQDMQETADKNEEELANLEAETASINRRIRSIQSSNKNFKLILVFFILALVAVGGVVIFTNFKIWLNRS